MSAEPREAIELIIPPQVQEVLEDRAIRPQDLRQVIGFAETSGRKLRHRFNEHLLAHFKPGEVTFWVEYSPQEEGFLIHNAYSHRMEIDEVLEP